MLPGKSPMFPFPWKRDVSLSLEEKPLWLFNPENLSDDRWIEFSTLKDQELTTSRAWAIKEQFRWFWEYRYAGNARKFFNSGTVGRHAAG